MMIPDSVELTPGLRVRQDSDRVLCAVNELLPDMTNYELTGELGARTVTYAQLEPDDLAAKTKLSRSEADFRANFTVERSEDQGVDFYYNPALIGTIELDNGELTDAVTHLNFIGFAVENGHTKRIASMAFNACASDLKKYHTGIIVDGIIIVSGNGLQVDDPTKRYAAVPMQHYLEYAEAFRKRKIPGVGDEGIELFLAFDRALRTPPIED